jgi:glycosidase
MHPEKRRPRAARRGRLVALLSSLLGLCILSPASEGQANVYMENVVFSVHTGESTFGGIVNEVYILEDHYGGRNKLQNARRLTNMGGDLWSITIPLQEGDYIYIFCANPTQYVNLSDPDLNPDDVPHSNFFNDPHPRFPGYGGQYSTDNLYLVRDPNRPHFDATMSSPKPGDEITRAPLQLSFRVNRGASNTAIDPMTAKVQIEASELYGLVPGALDPPAVTLSAADSVSFSGDATGGLITATINSPPEGLHVVHVDVSTIDMYAADTLLVPIYINRQNQAPIADAGPSRFGLSGHWIEVDGGSSRDPDVIGFSGFTWRKISGPGNMDQRNVGQEPDNNDPNQRHGDGSPVIDADGNAVSLLPPMGAVPQLRFDQPGDYVVGLVATDKEGLASTEATTEVHVAAAYDGTMKMRLHVGRQNGKVIASARASDLPDATPISWFADAKTPVTLAPVAGTNGRDVEIQDAQPGVYFVHARAGDPSAMASYPADAVVLVNQDGSVSGKDIARSPRDWREDTVLYLLFVREFFDSDGDGEGDFKGATQNIPWLKALGVNAVWVMPVEPGGTTAGYSMDSFFALHPDYGHMADLEEFIKEAHKNGIRVILDLVLNHTSLRHPWFAMAQPNTNAVTRDRYYFRADGSYMYAFSFVGLPDQNYNNPIVRTTAYDRADFWLDRGFDGFRCDVAGFTPNSVWRHIRRQMLSRSTGDFMVAEMIPPTADYMEEQFDAFYDPQTFWSARDVFAGNAPFSELDGAIQGAEAFVESASRPELHDRLDPADLIRMRYLDNQDEDRFLLRAGGSKPLLKVASSVQLLAPGLPLVNYGDEVSMVQGRGRMSFMRDPDMTAHYKKFIRIRMSNPGLRGQSTDLPGAAGNTYARISSDGDLSAGQVFSFLRYGSNQVFVVLANREQSSVIGTPVIFYLGQPILDLLPDGPLVMTNHANPSDTLMVTKSQLLAGYTAHIGSYETKVYQISNIAIPDADGDGIPDSFDSCIGVPNIDDGDDDFDGVANACDHCPSSMPGEDVGMDGCARAMAAPKPLYQLDGKIDDEGYLVAQQGDIKLYASFNGRQLYVAMTGAKAGSDHVIYFRDPSTNEPMQAAAFSKAGHAAAKWAMLDEGRGDRALWSGPWVGTKIVAPGPLEDGVTETTINLAERYGSSFPQKIQLAAVRYQTGANGGVVAQAPQATTADNEITPDEMVNVTLTMPTITPAQTHGGMDGGTGDASAIGDAGMSVCAHATGMDTDGDGVDDGCDLCPNTPKGAVVDSTGCSAAQSKPPGNAFDNGMKATQSSCRCNESSTSPSSAWWMLIVVMLLAARRIRTITEDEHALRRSSLRLLRLAASRRLEADHVRARARARARSRARSRRRDRWRGRLIALGLLLAGCGNGFTSSSTQPPPDYRLITGHLSPPDPRIFAKQPLALELVGVSLDARAQDPVLAFYSGTPVSATSNGRDPATVRLAVPQTHSLVLFFQIPTDGYSGIGQMVAPLRFPRNASGMLTDVIRGKMPSSTVPLKDIDLGVMDITMSGRSFQVLLGMGSSVNPLKINDINGNGVSDFDDPDSNNDFIPDDQETVSNADGVPDADESLNALPDADGDGIPDRFESTSNGTHS